MRTPGPEDRVRRLIETTDEGTAAELFVTLCRASSELRHWLWEDFARDPKVRESFRQRLRNRSGVVHRFAELSDDGDGWRRELRDVRNKFPRQLYGGLTWSQLEKLIAQHRAAKTDLGAYLFTAAWHASGKRAPRSPLLIRAALDLMDAAFADPRLFRQLERLIAHTRDNADRASRRAALGYTDWWKLNVLLYMLRHPRGAYPIREFRAHLARRGMNVSVKYLQRFCTQHGIKRDVRAGRPRIRKPDSATETGVNGLASTTRGRSTASHSHRVR
ncbi:hypothetical protein DB347_07030 [Opitutaceae bacterium EW11]|nr:hypothetical protein DB347_07030 [Opitutaceae bacterium EW11]